MTETQWKEFPPHSPRAAYSPFIVINFSQDEVVWQYPETLGESMKDCAKEPHLTVKPIWNICRNMTKY